MFNFIYEIMKNLFFYLIGMFAFANNNLTNEVSSNSFKNTVKQYINLFF